MAQVAFEARCGVVTRDLLLATTSVGDGLKSLGESVMVGLMAIGLGLMLR